MLTGGSAQQVYSGVESALIQPTVPAPPQTQIITPPDAGAATITLAERAAASEALSITVTLAEADAAGAAEALSVTVTTSPTDAGGAADSVTAASAVPLAQPAAAADAPAVTAAVPLAERAAATDATSVAAAVGVTDTAGGSETVAAGATVPLAEAAGAADALAVARPKMETLADSFPGSTLSTLWNGFNNGALIASSGLLTLSDTASTAGFTHIDSAGYYDLTGSYLLAHLVSAGSQYAHTQAVLQVQVDASNTAAFMVSNGSLIVQTQAATVYTTQATTAYSAATHAWLRIRESAGTLYFDYSADSLTWTNFASVTSPWAVTGVQALILEGQFGAGLDPAATSQWANVNLPQAIFTDAAGASEQLAVTVTVTNDASGGTNGVTLTQGSGGNTGGASGAYFDVITIGTGCGVAFDNSRGPLAVSFTTPAVAANAVAAWTTSLFPSAAATQAWGRIQPYLTANPPTICRLLRFLSGATLRGAAGVNPSGKLVLIDSAGTTQATSVMTLPLNARFRLEVRLAGSATTGQIEAQLYVGANVDGTTPDETVITGSTVNTGGTISRLDFGNPSSSASYTITAWGFGGSTTTWLGPAPVGTVASLPDAAAGADQVAATAAAPVPEAAAGVEGLTVAATLAVADNAAAVDQPSVSATALLAEAGAGADASAASATVPLAEAAGSKDQLAVAAATTVADAGGASDQSLISAATPLAEVAAAAESQLIGVAPVEAAAAAEQLAVTVTAQVVDAAGASDAISAQSGLLVSLAEAAAGTEQLAASVASLAADTGGAADTVGVQAALPVSDQAGAADAIAVAGGAAPQLPEAGAATDTAAITAATGLPDQAGAAEAISVAGAASITLADAGAAADAPAVSTNLPLPDAAAAAEALAVVRTAQPVLPDAGAVRDDLGASVVTARGDAAAASDVLLVVPLLSIAVADSAAASEQILISIPPAVPVPAWEAGPLAPRWQVTAAEPSWQVDAAGLGWETVLIPPRWEVSAATAEWRIVMAEFEPVASISKEAIPVLWTSDLGGAVTDPTAMAVQFAFPASSGDPAHPATPSTWYPGTWTVPVSGGYKGFIAQAVIGPVAQGGLVQLAAGRYDVWSSVTTPDETPRRFAGVLTVY